MFKSCIFYDVMTSCVHAWQCEQCKLSKIFLLIAHNQGEKMPGITMSLLKFFRVKNPALPSSSMCAYSSLSIKDLDHVNKEVKRAGWAIHSRPADYPLPHTFIASCTWAHNLSCHPIKNSPICSREWFAKFNARQSFPLYIWYVPNNGWAYMVFCCQIASQPSQKLLNGAWNALCIH